MEGLDYKSNAAFSNIGDLPTGYFCYPELKPLFIRPFNISELNLIHRGKATGRLEHIVRAVDLVTNRDTLQLTDGDFEFVMAWLRVQSFPEVPLLVQWKCTKVNVLSKYNKTYYRGPELTDLQMKLKGYEREVCNHDNTEIVHNHNTTITSLDDDFEQKGFETTLEIDFPRVATLIEWYELKEEQPELAEIASLARWLKKGDNLKEKLEAFYELPAKAYTELSRVAEKYRHGVRETVHLRCNLCENSLTHTTGVDHTAFFSDNSQTAIMDMQYKLMTAFKTSISENTPAKVFLYHYSSLLKDEQEEIARQNANRNKR